MDGLRVQECKGATVQRQSADRTLAASRGIVKIRNPHGHRSDLIVTRRPNGGIAITQGPSHVLIGPDELGPLVQAIAVHQSIPTKESDSRHDH